MSNGSSYYLSYVDAFSWFTWFHFLAHKSDAASVLKSFQVFVENQLNCQIKVAQTDNESEFLGSFHTHLISSGILHIFICSYTSQQNGMLERKHKDRVKLGLTLLVHSSVPFKY